MFKPLVLQAVLPIYGRKKEKINEKKKKKKMPNERTHIYRDLLTHL